MTENHVLQLIPYGVPLVIHVSQYDTDRKYIFTPYYGSSAYAKPDGAAVFIEATKPDGTVVADSITYNSDGTLQFIVKESMTQAAGDVRSKIIIQDSSGSRLASANVVFAVDRAGIDTYARVSESDLEVLHDVEKKLISLDEKVTAAANSAAEAGASETNARNSQEAAKGYADSASESAAAAGSSKSAAAKSAETASSAASAAVESKEAAGKSEENAKTSASKASESATAASKSEGNAGESATRAEEAAKKAEAVSAVKVATRDIAGVVKPDGATMVVAADGTLSALKIGIDESTGEIYTLLG